jgi:TPP-dependent pyruvate/acetoin dehydrogenase alpha subunit
VVAPYGFERATVDGGDVGAVFEAFGEFLAAARGGQGPMLLECLTHRRRGHYEGDSEEYRDALADEEWAQLDPVAGLEQRALGEGWIDQAGLDAIRSRARAEVDAAVEFARNSPFPTPELAAELVYAR